MLAVGSAPHHDVQYSDQIEGMFIPLSGLSSSRRNHALLREQRLQFTWHGEFGVNFIRRQPVD